MKELLSRKKRVFGLISRVKKDFKNNLEKCNKYQKEAYIYIIKQTQI